MITPISFKSSYIVRNSKNEFEQKKFLQFRKYSSYVVNNFDWCSATYTYTRSKNFDKSYDKELIELYVPDRFDEMVENYCYRRGITYKKLSSNNP